MGDKEFFNWEDCWVITSFLLINENEFEIDLAAIIANGDLINVAIFNADELKNGFYKAQKKGLIKILKNKICLTEQCVLIRQKLFKQPAGRYTLVDKLKKILNAKKTNLPDVAETEIDLCKFINSQSLQIAYKKYKKNTL